MGLFKCMICLTTFSLFEHLFCTNLYAQKPVVAIVAWDESRAVLMEKRYTKH